MIPTKPTLLSPRTAERVREMIARRPSDLGAARPLQRPQVCWVLIVGELDEDGWYPCQVSDETEGGWIDYPLIGQARTLADDGEPLAEGVRYLAIRRGDNEDGEPRYRVLGPKAYTSADDAGVPTAWRRDGFQVLEQFSYYTPRIDVDIAGGEIIAIELADSALTVPAAGWYDVDLRLNLSAGASSIGGRPHYTDVSLRARLFRIKADGTLGQQLVPWWASPAVVLRLRHWSYGDAENPTIIVMDGNGSFSLRGTFYLPDDERGLRVMLEYVGSNFSPALSDPAAVLNIISTLRVEGHGSLHAEWAGPRIDLPEPPLAPVTSSGQAIATGYSPNPEEVYQWTLDGTASYPPLGETITGYSWSVLTPDSSTVTGSGATWTNEWDSWGEGLHVATLTVTFSGGGSDTDTHEFVIPYEPPEPAGLTVFVFGDDGDGVFEPPTEGGTFFGRYVWIQGIDVEDGLLAPTDEDGYVYAEDLTPGTYSVSIWPASLGPGEYVSTSPHPVTVVLTAGATPEVQIGIATLGSGGGSGPDPEGGGGGIEDP